MATWSSYSYERTESKLEEERELGGANVDPILDGIFDASFENLSTGQFD
jgi:hypothetical protein